jgi:cold shock CspA family protein/ribosome-associated translation inhibitor RaiA
MELPLQITFRNMSPSDAIETSIKERARKLDSFYDRIMGCRVVVEAPHRRHHKGRLYHVRIDITVPGGELVVNREPSKHAAHGDVYVAIRDAFDAARRKLQDHGRRRRGAVKLHESAAHARISKLFPEQGYGFLETHDGREIYFHRNSLLELEFDRLPIGTEVRFTEKQGKEGPQASTVRPIARKH